VTSSVSASQVTSLTAVRPDGPFRPFTHRISLVCIHSAPLDNVNNTLNDEIIDNLISRAWINCFVTVVDWIVYQAMHRQIWVPVYIITAPASPFSSDFPTNKIRPTSSATVQPSPAVLAYNKSNSNFVVFSGFFVRGLAEQLEWEVICVSDAGKRNHHSVLNKETTYLPTYLTTYFSSFQQSFLYDTIR